MDYFKDVPGIDGAERVEDARFDKFLDDASDKVDDIQKGIDMLFKLINSTSKDILKISPADAKNIASFATKADALVKNLNKKVDLS
jgi:hypothetical protein